MKIKQKLRNWLLKNLLGALTEEEVFRNLNQGKVDSYAIQAQEYLSKGALFNDMKTEMDRISEIHMFRNPVDILFGQAMLYTNDLWEKKLTRLANGRPDQAMVVGRESQRQGR